MGVIERVADLLTDWAHRPSSIPFTDPTASPNPPRALSGPAGASSLVAAGPAGETPEDSATSGVSRHPHPAGSNLHTPHCLYTHTPEHRCVAADGQPSRTVCIASLYRTNRTPKEVA